MNAIEVLERLAADIPDAGDIANPDWTDCAQSWRAYVPEELRAAWATLPPEARLLAVTLGEQLVSRERWD